MVTLILSNTIETNVTKVTCPLTDLPASSNGTCPTGYITDPDYPGCCMSSCPSTCSSDSDCSACGPDFVCENGQCVKQIPATVNTEKNTLSLQSKATYTMTGCFYFIGVCNCLKCQESFAPYFGSDGMDVYVEDSSGRPIPRVPVSIKPSVADSSLGFSYYVSDAVGTKEYNSNSVATAVTDNDGKISLSVSANVMPVGYQNISDSNYQCTACSTNNNYNNVVGPLNYGSFAIGVVGTPIEAFVSIVDTVQIEGIKVQLGGCSCV